MIKTGISIEDIIFATNGELINEVSSIFKNISTDSRNIYSDCLFIPIKGENFDGHNFISKAIENGTEGVLIEKNSNIKINNEKTFIEVENTLKAYQNIATFIRRKLNTTIIGITGSSGKTSTKEIMNAFSKQFFDTYKTEANFNNEIGVPYTLIKLNENHRVGIVEMGMRGSRQIEELANIAEPNIGIITGVGSAHIELLGSKHNIALAKWELAEYLIKTGGTIVIPEYDSYLNDLANNSNYKNIIKVNIEKSISSTLQLEKHWVEDNKQFFVFTDNETKKTHEVLLSVLGKHQISNALLVLAVGKVLNINYPSFIDLSFENLSGRSETFKLKKALITNDSYNANPESMHASIETFCSLPDKRKILVIGEMRELGDFAKEAHFDTGKFCSNFDFEELIVIGESAKEIVSGFESQENNLKKHSFFTNNLEAGNYLKKYLNEETSILFKASRGAKLEEVIAVLQQN